MNCFIFDFFLTVHRCGTTKWIYLTKDLLYCLDKVSICSEKHYFFKKLRGKKTKITKFTLACHITVHYLFVNLMKHESFLILKHIHTSIPAGCIQH